MGLVMIGQCDGEVTRDGVVFLCQIKLRKEGKLPHEDGLADLADRFETAGEEGKREVETKAAEQD